MKHQNQTKWIVIKIVFGILFLCSFSIMLLSTNLQWDESLKNGSMFIILLLSILAVFYPLLNKEKTPALEIAIVGICVLLLVIAVITFASVATGNLREPVIQISAAFIGGAITLYGIGLTIKYNRIAKEEDDIKKAKPNFFPISKQIWSSLANDTKLVRDVELIQERCNLDVSRPNEMSYSFSPIYLTNSDQAMCALDGIIINDKYYIVFKYGVVLLKESINCFKIDYSFSSKEEIETVQLVAGDMINNIYTCEVSFEYETSVKKNKKQIAIMGVLNIKKLDKKHEDAFLNYVR